MKKPIIKFFDKVILLILGLSPILYSCEKYGMPSATYELKGKVTSKNTSYPIKHIQITTQMKYERPDTLYTNSRGEYYYKVIGFPLDQPLYLKFEDIDGEENGGEFISQEVDIIFDDADLIKKGKDKWDNGTFAKTQNIQLERKK